MPDSDMTFSTLGDGRARARHHIRERETISYIVGEIVDTEHLLRRIRSDHSDISSPHQIGHNLYVLPDATSRSFGHSCCPNAGIRHFNEVFALRDIAAEELVTYDFSTTVGMSRFDSLWQMQCECGHDRCRRRIGSVLTLDADRLRSYAIAGALPKFILEQLIRHGNAFVDSA
jgi:hypothetical protein